MIDELARPRVGIVLPGGEDARVAAVAARALTLALLDRLPRVRVAVLVSGGAAPRPSPLDAGRPARRLTAQDRQDCDVLLVAGAETKVAGRSAGGACPVVRLPGSLLDVAALARAAGGEELRRNRVDTLRLLGWLPAGASTPHVVVDGATGAVDLDEGEVAVTLPEHAGVDEVVAAIASAARYAGSDPLLRAIAGGAAPPSLAEALDVAAAAAIDCWHGRGSPDAVADARPARRIATQHAALRVELRMVRRDVDAAERRAAGAEKAAQLITGSRTWRYTERVRGAYHSARGRLRR